VGIRIVEPRGLTPFSEPGIAVARETMRARARHGSEQDRFRWKHVASIATLRLKRESGSVL
jgi:hypothetical protein